MGRRTGESMPFRLGHQAAIRFPQASRRAAGRNPEVGAGGGSQSTALRPRSRQAVQSLPWGYGTRVSRAAGRSLPHALIKAESMRFGEGDFPGIRVERIQDVICLVRNDYRGHPEQCAQSAA